MLQCVKNEIIRRYFTALNNLAQGKCNDDEVNKIALLLKQAKIDVNYRKSIKAKLVTEQLKADCHVLL